MRYFNDMDGEKIWWNIKTDIELRIITGEYIAGERIPPVRKLAEIYGVGTGTAVKAVDQLYIDGTIFKKRGKGFFVAPYIISELKKSHTVRLEKKLSDACEYAKMLGVDAVAIVNKISSCQVTG